MSERQANNSLFEHRLAGYAIAAGAALVGANQADAGIVYSGPLNLNIPVIPDGGSPDPSNVFFPDFDGDGNPDFILGTAVLNSGADIGGIAAASVGIVAVDVGGSPFASALTMGSLIDAGSITSGKGKLTLDTLPPTMAVPTPWQPGVDAFIGLAFVAPSGTNNGWVEARIENDYSVTIEGWAYNDEGGPILAGQTAVPEPSSLALLAAGAVGVVAFAARKRRAVASASQG